MLEKLIAKGRWREASDEECSRQYDILCETLAEAGYHHYEISNFALPGHRARHNSAYWNHSHYLGLGPGAHGFLDGRRFWNNPSLESYLQAAADGDFTAVRGFEDLTPYQMVLERVMLGLRTSDGVDADFLRTHCAAPALASAIASGDIVPVGSRLRIPESRFFVSDAIISELI